MSARLPGTGNEKEKAFDETIDNAVTDKSCFTQYKPLDETKPAETVQEDGKEAPRKKAHILAKKIIDKKAKKRKTRNTLNRYHEALQNAKRIIAYVEKNQKKVVKAA